MGNFRDLDAAMKYAENHLRTSDPYHKYVDEEYINTLLADLPYKEERWNPAWSSMEEYFSKQDQKEKAPDDDEAASEHASEYGDGGASGWRSEPYGGGKKGKGKGGKKGKDKAKLHDQIHELRQQIEHLTASGGSGANAPQPPKQLAILQTWGRAAISGMIENMMRAETSLAAAQRVAQGAAQQFGQEQNNIQTARHELERLLRDVR